MGENLSRLLGLVLLIMIGILVIPMVINSFDQMKEFFGQWVHLKNIKM
jgi:hypothetical protein